MGLSISEASALVRKSKKTLYRWRKAGVRIDDEKVLREYSTQMDASSKGASHSKALDRLSSDKSDNDIETSELPSVGEPGAVQALQRLQLLEVAFAQRVTAALAKGNSKLIQSARADHCAIAESMRKYEIEIEESRRDLGHLVPRSEMLDGIRAGAMWLRLGLMSWISSYLPALLAHTNPREAKEFLLNTFGESLRVSIMNSREATLSIPPEGEAIILEEFRVKI